jgi:hypothetical protein
MSTLNGGPGNIVTNGLVLYLDAANYLSYTSGSTTWSDLSSSNISGSLINGPTFSSLNAGSIVFDGVDDYVGLAGIQAPSFTITSWVKLNELNRFHGIMGRADSIFSNLSYAFRILSSNQLSISLSNSGTSNPLYVEVTSPTSLQISTWYNLTVTFSKPTTTLYVNANASITDTNFNSDLFNSTSNSIIGGYTYGNGLNFLMKGNISNMQFYNRALTASEVLQNYNATKARFGL